MTRTIAMNLDPPTRGQTFRFTYMGQPVWSEHPLGECDIEAIKNQIAALKGVRRLHPAVEWRLEMMQRLGSIGEATPCR